MTKTQKTGKYKNIFLEKITDPNGNTNLSSIYSAPIYY